MKTKSLFAITFLLLALLSLQVQAADTHYVDRNNALAVDSGPGTETQPWRTITYGASHIEGGDTLVVKGGSESSPVEYPERITSLPSGAPTGKTIIKAEPRRSVRMQGFFLQNVEHIRIEGFQIRYETATWSGGGVQFRGSHGEIVDNYIENVPYCPAIWTRGGTDSYIADNHIYNVQMGIVVESSAVVERNEIERLRQLTANMDCDYFRGFGDNITIRNNYCHGTLQSEKGDAHVDLFQTFCLSIDKMPLTNFLFEGNLAVGYCSQGVYVQDSTGRAHNIMIRNNIFKDFSSGIINIATEPTSAITNVSVYNNVFYNGAGGVQFDGQSSGAIKNNVFFGLWSQSLNKPQYGDHNLYYNSVLPASQGTGDIVGLDPLFVDPAVNNFHVTPTSPLIDVGENLSVYFSTDKDGVTRPKGAGWDIGAYEFVPAQPQTWSLIAGWNWISFNVIPSDLSLNSIFTGILSQIEQVKTQTQSAIRSNGNWKGDLANMNGIGSYKMYKIKVTQACTLTISGTADLSANPIHLGGGWNWVAYLPTTVMPIATALDSIKGQVLQVKSLSQSATYNGTLWSGTLTQLEPGQGYAIKMSGPGILIYSAAASTQLNQQKKNK